MKPRARPYFLARFRSFRFLGLLLAVLGLLIGSPFFGTTVFSRAAVALLLSTLLFATVIAASNAPHQRSIAAVLATVCGIILFAGLLFEHRVIYLPIVALLTIYLVYTIAVVLRRMISATEIDADILCGAAATYFLIGVVWALTYWLIYAFDTGAFAVASSISEQPHDLHQFLYYSFSTLTSLGIGGINPVNRFAQIWTTLETATGNLYIAVLVARLVSLYR